MACSGVERCEADAELGNLVAAAAHVLSPLRSTPCRVLSPFLLDILRFNHLLPTTTTNISPYRRVLQGATRDGDQVVLCRRA